ncbi:MAG: hypothetical protein ABIU09_08805 [Pyrinomonadaceae bacterium]
MSDELKHPRYRLGFRPDAMKYLNAAWAEKRKTGLIRYLLFDGILITGGPFAVLMQAVGFFILRDEGQSFGQYFTAPGTWMTFFFHATLFGLFMGFINGTEAKKVTDPVRTPRQYPKMRRKQRNGEICSN